MTALTVPTKPYPTVAEFAEIFGVHPTTAYSAARRGELPTLKIGRRVLVDLAAYLRQQEEARGAGQHTTDGHDH